MRVCSSGILVRKKENSIGKCEELSKDVVSGKVYSYFESVYFKARRLNFCTSLPVHYWLPWGRGY